MDQLPNQYENATVNNNTQLSLITKKKLKQMLKMQI